MFVLILKIEEIRKKHRPNFDHIIIDCSPVNYMDMMGIKSLIQVIDFIPNFLVNIIKFNCLDL